MNFNLLLSVFIITKTNFNSYKTLEFYPKSGGYDERHSMLINETDDTLHETLLNIKKNIIKADILKRLVNPSIGMIEKQAYIEEYETTFGEYKQVHNLSAGGLWTDFYKEIL
jgi:hypothetical protein